MAFLLHPRRRKLGNKCCSSHVEENLKTRIAVPPSKGTRKPGMFLPCGLELENHIPVEGNSETSKETRKRRRELENNPYRRRARGRFLREMGQEPNVPWEPINVHPSQVRINKKETTAEPREGIASWRFKRSSTVRRPKQPVEFRSAFASQTSPSLSIA